MKLNLTSKPEIIERPKTTLWTLETSGEHLFEIAPLIWIDFLKLLEPHFSELTASEYMGISSINKGIEQEIESIYKAAISVPSQSKLEIAGLKKEVYPQQKYAKFLLKGSHSGVWPAFEESLKVVNDSEWNLGDGECLEIYLNDPNNTPEEELLTEILIPLEA